MTTEQGPTVTDPMGIEHTIVPLVRKAWTFQYGWGGWEFYLVPSTGTSVAFARKVAA